MKKHFQIFFTIAAAILFLLNNNATISNEMYFVDDYQTKNYIDNNYDGSYFISSNEKPFESYRNTKDNNNNSFDNQWNFSANHTSSYFLYTNKLSQLVSKKSAFAKGLTIATIIFPFQYFW